MGRKRFVVLAVALLALNLFFWLAQSGFSLTQGLISQFFGGRMVRAEVVLQAADGSIQDYRLDQGVIVALSGGAVTLRERDGNAVAVPIDPNAQVYLGTQVGTPSVLHRRMRIIMIRLANAPATQVQVLGY
jgi:hypothetical protein